MAWVSWNTVCKNRESGGLGVKDVEKFNKALLGKWKWRSGLEEEGLWIDIVNSKYGSWKSLDSIDSKKCESRWWRDLRSISGNSEGGQWFNKNLIWSVGSGSKIYFWEDVWVGVTTLKVTYPRIYANSIQKNLKIQDFGEWQGQNWNWNFFLEKGMV